jgi:hypothetical protein
MIVRADIIWAVVTIFNSSAAGESACAGDSNIWTFCLVAVIIMPIVGCVINMFARLAESAGIIAQTVPSVINLVIAVWGVLLWANMTEECMSFYDNDFNSLLLLFKINVILLSISFVILVLVVVAGAAALTAALSHGKTARYENIPDSVPQQSSTLTEEYV